VSGQARVVVCRGCCCGNDRRDPGTNHAGQLDALQQRLGDRVNVSGCLGPCAHANIVVVVPSRAGRDVGGRATWLGWVIDETATDLIVDWVEAGGPGLATIPATLDLHRFHPPQRTGRPRARTRSGRR
jgi:(2Fe-2S) ferredoxin